MKIIMKCKCSNSNENVINEMKMTNEEVLVFINVY